MPSEYRANQAIGSAITEKDVRAKLRQDELDDQETDIADADAYAATSEASKRQKKKKRGRGRKVTAAAFLVMGLELEVAQCVAPYFLNGIEILTPL